MSSLSPPLDWTLQDNASPLKQVDRCMCQDTVTVVLHFLGIQTIGVAACVSSVWKAAADTPVIKARLLEQFGFGPQAWRLSGLGQAGNSSEEANDKIIETLKGLGPKVKDRRLMFIPKTIDKKPLSLASLRINLISKGFKDVLCVDSMEGLHGEEIRWSDEDEIYEERGGTTGGTTNDIVTAIENKIVDQPQWILVEKKWDPLTEIGTSSEKIERVKHNGLEAIGVLEATMIVVMNYFTKDFHMELDAELDRFKDPHRIFTQCREIHPDDRRCMVVDAGRIRKYVGYYMRACGEDNDIGMLGVQRFPVSERVCNIEL